MNLLAHLHVADHLPPIAAAGNLTMDFCKENWEPDLTRADFIESRLRDIHEFRNQLPRPASFVLSRMTKLRWLHCYSEIDGIGATIRRIAARRPALARMVGAEQWMEQRFDDFLGIFRRFYPELQAHISAGPNHHKHDPACAPEGS